MTVRFSSSYDRSAREVLDLLQSPSFAAEFAKELGDLPCKFSARRSGKTVHLEYELAVSTKGIPGVFRSLVGHEVGIMFNRSIVSRGADGYAGALDVVATTKAKKATVDGTIALRPTATGSELAYEGKVRIDVPAIIRGKVKDAIEDLAEGVLEDEAKVLAKLLGRRAA